MIAKTIRKYEFIALCPDNTPAHPRQIISKAIIVTQEVDRPRKPAWHYTPFPQKKNVISL